MSFLTKFRQRFWFTRTEAFAMVQAEFTRVSRLTEELRAELSRQESALISTAMSVNRAVVESERGTSEYLVTVRFSKFLMRTPHTEKFIEKMFRNIAGDLQRQDGQREPWKLKRETPPSERRRCTAYGGRNCGRDSCLNGCDGGHP